MLKHLFPDRARHLAAALLVLWSLFPTGIHAADIPVAPDLPPRVVAPTDKAEFRRFVLENGLRVILVSDPKFNKSAASLVVGVGQIDDPFEHAGLAHFLEHMLFLGTEKYPDVSEYRVFITANGGYNNAYTASDHTNYLFEVRHEAFPEALDRFVQFFIAPLFSPEYTGREVNAVHNEAMRHVQDDFRRVLSVRRELYAPESGESIFSTGNKDTLANATPEVVRAFYEANYSAERMALALAGTASLDELEKLARSIFSAIPRRDLPVIPREARFLPREDALRLATVEPVLELRQLLLEFPIPPVRSSFAGKPGDLVVSLLNYAGEGGLIRVLKDADLATVMGSFYWERTPGYGSLFIMADLTPAGAEQRQRVLEIVFAYLAHLRAAPFPAAFFADQARIAALSETYDDRGEGADLATRLANNALFYPLELAERADLVWGAPDEPAFRALLAALTPDNMLATFAAKGVPTDRVEKIYDVQYAYSADTGEAYQRLLNPLAPPAAFALPAPNPFMPGEVNLIAEQPLRIIDEPGLSLYYAQDVEFQRPQTTLIFSFVPRREFAGLETDLMLRFYEVCLGDALDAAGGDAAVAGVTFDFNAGLEGVSLSVTGFGDSPARFARHVASLMLNFDLAESRFVSLRELVVRDLRSYHQTEAYLLAGNRATAIMREFFYEPNQHLERALTVTLDEVRAFAREFLAAGKVEALVHGHLVPQAAAAAARDFAAALGAKAVPSEELMRRRLLVLPAGAAIVETGVIEGVNSAYRAQYLLPEDSPAVRAMGAVLAAFISEPFFNELRTKQQLGYIVGSNVAATLRQSLLLFIVQSSGYAPDDIRQRAETFIATLPEQLRAATPEQWAMLIAGARSQLEEKPKSIPEKAGQMFTLAYDFGGEWQRREATLAALDTLTQDEAIDLLSGVLNPAAARSIVVLLASKEHAASTAASTFSDRERWRATQNYE